MAARNGYASMHCRPLIAVTGMLPNALITDRFSSIARKRKKNSILFSVNSAAPENPRADTMAALGEGGPGHRANLQDKQSRETKGNAGHHQYRRSAAAASPPGRNRPAGRSRITGAERRVALG